MENCRYNIFKTRWGWFGLLGNERGILRTYLPMASKESIQKRVLSDCPDAKPSKTAFSMLETRIRAYYEGNSDGFQDVGICLDDFTEFQQQVLTTLRKITYGKRISYGDLAKRAGRPGAARAIGSVMAANPLPLIIPCHRVIKADGSPGQFSAPGGIKIKKRMLGLENKGHLST
ncbi:MAG: methylated-DNA--[protein]-cysteine S-methyltransferase [Planctomycetota bacterium]|jgi:methylated-DNA-[protein]-cysteine S-methyltransferase